MASLSKDTLKVPQTVLVTGAVSGIGRAIAEAFAQQGARLAILDRRADEQLALTAEELRAAGAVDVLTIQADLADVTQHATWIAHILDVLGPIDCLINNAGVGSPQRRDMLEVPSEVFDAVLGVNLRGTFFLTQQVAAHMLAHPAHPSVARSIITVSSISVEAASIDRAEYCISKSGLDMLTKLFALRLAPAAIPVFELRPGITHSAMTAPSKAKYDALIADGLVPAGRWGEGQDMADIVTGLASGAFAFATGTVVMADGGLTIPRM